MNLISEIFSYNFALRALAVGLLVSLCASVLGVNMVLKRFSMLGDGLSHVAFGAAAVALAVGAAPLKIAIPVVIAAAFLLMRISGNAKIRGDAAIAMVSSGALAIGVIVATLTTGMNTDINNYMFGSILAVSRSDLRISAVLALIVAAVYLLFYGKIFACAFDERFAAACGVRVKLFNGISAILTAVTVVIGMRMMGALLISSIMTFPALSAMRICKHYNTTVMVSAAVSLVSFIIGLLLSFGLDMPTGASVVTVELSVFLLFSLIEKLRSKATPNI